MYTTHMDVEYRYILLFKDYRYYILSGFICIPQCQFVSIKFSYGFGQLHLSYQVAWIKSDNGLLIFSLLRNLPEVLDKLMAIILIHTY